MNSNVNVVTKDDFDTTHFDITNSDRRGKIKVKSATIDFTRLQRVAWSTDTHPLGVKDGKLVLIDMDQ